MSSESESENRLLEWYERYVGPPARRRDVYAGFTLFFGGIALGVVCIVVFLWSTTQPDHHMFKYTLREVASTAGAVGLPALLLGITVLLPVDRRVVYAAVVGAVICLVGVWQFTGAYPYHWNVTGTTDRSAGIVALYAVGLVIDTASTGAALVGYRVEQARGIAVDPEDSVDESDDDTEERAQRDYEDAMANADVTWGGVAKTETKRLKLDTAGVDDIDRSSLDTATAKTSRSAGVDDAVAGLRNLQGGQAKTESSGGTDNQLAALQQLKEQQRREAEAQPDGIVARVKSLIR